MCRGYDMKLLPMFTSAIPKTTLTRPLEGGLTPALILAQLEPLADRVMIENPFRSRDSLIIWCRDNQTGYKKTVPEVVAYLSRRYGV